MVWGLGFYCFKVAVFGRQSLAAKEFSQHLGPLHEEGQAHYTDEPELICTCMMSGQGVSVHDAHTDEREGERGREKQL